MVHEYDKKNEYNVITSQELTICNNINCRHEIIYYIIH